MAGSYPFRRRCVRLIFVGNKHDQSAFGWQRQAESSELGDGGWTVRKTIAKALPALTLPPNPTKRSRTPAGRRYSFPLQRVLRVGIHGKRTFCTKRNASPARFCPGERQDGHY